MSTDSLLRLMTMLLGIFSYKLSYAASRVRLSSFLFQSMLSSTTNGSSDSLLDPPVKKLSDVVAYSGYRNIVQRVIELPNGQNATFDIVHQKHLSVTVFIWDSASCTSTLIREYHPGPEVYLFGSVAGMYEFSKHESALQAAQFELAEEAQLQTNQWHPLLADTDAKMPLDKYSNNQFMPFLALDCTQVSLFRPLDDEEHITIHPNITYPMIIEMIQSGRMNVVSTYTILMGIQKLLELGLPLTKP